MSEDAGTKVYFDSMVPIVAFEGAACRASCTHLITGDPQMAGGVPPPMVHVPLTMDGLSALAMALGG